LAALTLLASLLALTLGAALLALLLEFFGSGPPCGALAGGGGISLGSPGSGVLAGASEYGGPGDPSSGTVGASGADLLEHPDSYAELGGLTFQTATMMGGLAFMTPLRITWGARSAIAYKRDFGLGGGPIDGSPRVIDLWWQMAMRLGIPYEHGLWSGRVRLERPPATGAGNLLAAEPAPPAEATGVTAAADGAACAPGGVGAGVVPVAAGERAVLLADGLAAAPADAPLVVKEIIAAGNQIVGRPYLYGAAHGLPLSELAPAYDCSSSVEHLLYGGRLLPVGYGAASSALESFGLAGVGRWVTIYASPAHVFMYVAGLRWDTYAAAGPGDGGSGIGWHPLVRSSAGFVARHPVGL
jgi:hypothetical protein